MNVSIWLHQALKGYRDKDGNPLHNAHLLGVFQRICKLLHYGIRPVFVFDGGVPALKKQTMGTRRQKKIEAVTKSEASRSKLLRNFLQSHLQRENVKALPPSMRMESKISRMLASSPIKPKSKSNQKILGQDEVEEDLKEFVSKLTAEKGSQEIQDSSEEEEFLEAPNYADNFSTITSAHFDTLALESQHEILFQMQESKKMNSWKKMGEMPRVASEFSSFQMDRLLKRRFLQKKILSVQKEMGQRHIHVTNFDELKTYEDEFGTGAAETEVVGSKDKGALLIKMNPKPNAANEPSPIQESATPNSTFESNRSKISTEGLVQWESSSDQQANSSVNLNLDEEETNIQRAIHLSLNSQIPSRPQQVECKPKSDHAIQIQNEPMYHLNKTMASLSETATEISPSNKSPKGKSTNGSPSKMKIPMEKKSNLAGFEQCVAEDLSSACYKFLGWVGFPDNVNSVSASPIKQASEIKKNDVSPVPTSSSDDDFEEVGDVGEPRIEDEKTLVTKLIEASENIRKGVEIRIPETEIKAEEDFFADIFLAAKETEENESILDKIEPIQDQEKAVQNGEEIVESSISRTLGTIPTHRVISTEYLQNQEKLSAERGRLKGEIGNQERISASITDQMHIEAQELLSLFGIPFVVSPMEAESQCAFLDSACLTEGTITDDSDIWLFGGLRVYKNFFTQGEKHVEFFQYADIVRKLNLDREKLISMGMLVGSDYTNGIEGVGPVTAMEILTEFGSSDESGFDSLLKFYNWWIAAQDQEAPNKTKEKLKKLKLRPGFPSKIVYDAYMHPTIDSSTEAFKWGKPDLESLRSYTKHRFGWDQLRTDSILDPVLKQLNSQDQSSCRQSTLDRFISVLPISESKVSSKRAIRSKRLRRAIKKLKPSGIAPAEVDLSSNSDSDGNEDLPPAKTIRLPREKKGEIPQRLKDEVEQKAKKERAIKALKKKKLD